LTTFGAARIRYRGVVFGYQQQQIFWQAIERYLLQTAHEVFKRWDIETKTHSTVMRLRSIDGVARASTSLRKPFAATASTSEHTASQRAENRSGERIRVPTVQPADTWLADMGLTAVTCLLCCHVGFAAAKTLPRTLTCTRCGNKSQHELAKLIRPLSPAERRAEAQTWARYVGKRLGYRRTDQHVEGERAFTIGL